MKTLKNVMLVLIMSLAIVSCKKDDDGGDDPQGGDGTLTANVGGSSYTATFGITAQIAGSGSAQALTISGGTADSENLQITIQGFDGEGTYDLSFVNIGAYTILTDINNPMSAVIYSTIGDAQTVNGEVNVSSFDGNTAKGTFEFTAINLDDATDVKEVTNGAFNITVTNQ